jgi:hypothetical protein
MEHSRYATRHTTRPCTTHTYTHTRGPRATTHCTLRSATN